MTLETEGTWRRVPKVVVKEEMAAKVSIFGRSGPIRMALHLILVVLAVSFHAEVKATSSDCEKANTKVEKMICSNVEISRLDEEIATAYISLLSHLETFGAEIEKKKFLELRERWIREDAEKCEDVSCLMNSYPSRLMFLQESIENLKNINKSLNNGLLYNYCEKLTLSSHCGDQSGVGSSVCDDYLDYLNTLKARPVCETPVPPQFKRLDWQEMDVLTHLDLAYQAERAAWNFEWFHNKYPDFTTWKKHFLTSLGKDGISPVMLRTKALAKIKRPFSQEHYPTEFKEIEILSFVRNSQGCTNRLIRGKESGADAYSDGEGDVLYSTFTNNPDKPLQAISGIGSTTKGDILMYQDEIFMVGEVGVYGPLEFWWVNDFQSAHYTLYQKCTFHMVQQPQ